MRACGAFRLFRSCRHVFLVVRFSEGHGGPRRSKGRMRFSQRERKCETQFLVPQVVRATRHGRLGTGVVLLILSMIWLRRGESSFCHFGPLGLRSNAWLRSGCSPFFFFLWCWRSEVDCDLQTSNDSGIFSALAMWLCMRTAWNTAGLRGDRKSVV